MPKKKMTAVPRLRFPEFRDAGPWEVKRLGEIAEINPSTGPLPPSFVYIDLESVVAGELVQKKSISRKGAPSRAQRVLRAGDVIYQMVRPYQMNNLLFDMDDDQEYVASTGYAQLRAKGSNTFLYQLIHTTPFTNSVLEKCTGSNYPAISSSDLADVRTSVPSLPEQQKIADCLASLDDLTRAEKARLEALQAHKKGLMQQLFPAPGETTPRLRFPEFRNAGPWEVKRLGDVARLRNGYAFRSSAYVEEGVYRIVTIANVQEGLLSLESTKRIASLPNDIQQHQILSPGDILISMTGNVGRVCRVTTEKLLLNQRVGKLEPKNINAELLYQWLQRPTFRKIMELKAAGGAQGNLSSGDITGCTLLIPKSAAEQQQIADCLGSLDELIRAQAEKIEALKQHKKGLMQQLFPQGVG